MVDDWQPIDDWTPVAATKKKSLLDNVVQGTKNFVSNHAHDIGTTLGGIAGAGLSVIPDAAEIVGTGGLATPGAVATSMAMTGGGAALGGHYADVLKSYLTKQPEAPLPQQAMTAARDFSGNAAAVPGVGLAVGAIKKVAPVLGPAAKATISALTSLPKKTGAFMDAGSTAAAAKARQAALARTLAEQQAAEAAAKDAAVTAGSATRTAANDAMRQKTAQALSQPPAPAVGDVVSPTDMGAPIQQAAQKNVADIVANRDATYGQLSDASRAAADELKSAGTGVSDMPTAKAFVTDAQKKLDPIGNVVTNLTSGQEAAYKNVLKVLTPTERPLTQAEAAAAQAAGQKVNVAPGPSIENGLPGPPTYSITRKPDLISIENLRRQIANGSFDGLEGSAAIDKHTKQELYGVLSRIEDEYTSGLSQPAKDAWKKALDAAAPYQDTKIGKLLTAEQGDTGITRSTPSQIPQNIINQGRGGYQNLVQATNPAVAKKMISDSVQAALVDPATGSPVSYAAAKRAVGPTSKLGDILQSPDLADVRAMVNQHLARLQTAEALGQKATALGESSASAAKVADQSTAQAQQLAARARSLQSDISDLSSPELPKNKVVSTARKVVDGLFQNGKGSLSVAERDALMDLANHADNAAARSAFRRKVALYGAVGAGLSAEGVKLGGHALGVIP